MEWEGAVRKMNQQCKVCGEPAAGFHFGAFTCEGCKSFFGRSYNNLSSISECKNNGECVINKKNRTSCKACRLRKCLLVGMSKSGSRYGRRSNWFKIHCLLQEQQQQQQQAAAAAQQQAAHVQQGGRQKTPPPPPHSLGLLGAQFDPRLHHTLAAMQHHSLARATTKEELLLLGLDEYKHSSSPSVSSPESHNSDSSVEVSDARLGGRGGVGGGVGGGGGGGGVGGGAFKSPGSGVDAHGVPTPPHHHLPMPLPFPSLATLGHAVFPHSFLPSFAAQPGAPGALLFPPGSPYLCPLPAPPKTPAGLLKAANNNNNRYTINNNHEVADMYSKRFFLDAVLQSQRGSPVGSAGGGSAGGADRGSVCGGGAGGGAGSDAAPGDDSSDDDSRGHRSPRPGLTLALAADLQESPVDLSMKSARAREERLRMAAAAAAAAAAAPAAAAASALSPPPPPRAASACSDASDRDDEPGGHGAAAAAAAAAYAAVLNGHASRSTGGSGAGSGVGSGAEDADVEDDGDFDASDDAASVRSLREHRVTPIDLTTRV